MAESDAQLQLKKRARRRLVGAAALATLAAVVLPMVMDKEPAQQPSQVEVRIPESKPAVVATEGEKQVPVPDRKAVVADGADAPRPAASMPKPLADDASRDRKSREAEDRAAKERAERERAEKERLARERDERKELVRLAAEKERADKDAAAARDRAAREDKESRAREESEARKAAAAAEKVPATKAEGQWVVQLGAFSSEENVKQLLARVGGSGVSVFTEKLGSGADAKTRVRAGPYPSRDAAEKARAKLESLGLKGAVAPR